MLTVESDKKFYPRFSLLLMRPYCWKIELCFLKNNCQKQVFFSFYRISQATKYKLYSRIDAGTRLLNCVVAEGAPSNTCLGDTPICGLDEFALCWRLFVVVASMEAFVVLYGGPNSVELSVLTSRFLADPVLNNKRFDILLDIQKLFKLG